MLKLKKLKKKILKEITVFDLAMIFLGLLVVGYMLFYFRRKKAPIYVDLTFERQDWNNISFPPEYWEVDSLHVGDKGYNSVGKKVAEIKEIEKNFWDGGKRLYVEIQVELDAIYNTTTRTYVYDGSPLLIGEELSLQFGKTSFTGIVSNVYQSLEDRFIGYQLADAVVVVHYRNYDPWHAEAIKDLEVTNSQGEVILKTKEAQVTLAEKVVVTDRGDVLLRWDPTKRDITATFELTGVLCRDQLCYYNRYQTFMVGDEFWADSGQTYTRGGSVMSSTINYRE